MNLRLGLVLLAMIVLGGCRATGESRASEDSGMIIPGEQGPMLQNGPLQDADARDAVYTYIEGFFAALTKIDDQSEEVFESCPIEEMQMIVDGQGLHPNTGEHVTFNVRTGCWCRRMVSAKDDPELGSVTECRQFTGDISIYWSKDHWIAESMASHVAMGELMECR